MLDRETAEKLREMGLFGMAQAASAQEQGQEADALSFAERFGLLVDAEWTYRRSRRLARLLREARLRLPACLEDVDFGPQRGLSRSLVRSLGTGRWLEDRLNVLVVGPTGAGKTFLACALANAACRLGYSARYYRVPRLTADLTIARGDGSYRRTLAKLARFDLLVLDDMGISPLTPGESRDLLELVDDRSQFRSTVVASQLPIEAWHGAMGDPTLADAILDRLVHNAHKIVLKGESMRKIKAGLPQGGDSDTLETDT
ncbi:MAG: IS21-like element helper ATPase IstB [Bacteroidota bacterium]